MRSWQFDAIGTQWSIELFEPIADDAYNNLIKTVAICINDFDKVYSRFRPDSLVSAIAKEAGVYTLPDNAQKLFAIYQKMYDLSDGLVTPLIGQTIADAGYDAQYSLNPKPLVQPPKWEDVMNYDGSNLTVQQPVLLDFGAAGKGYLVDLVGEVITQQGVQAYCIDAGGDMLHRAVRAEPLRVGLEHPDDTSQVIGVAHLLNQALCGSAGNRRAWAQYHHILNPRSLQSPRHIKALWVVADDCITSDALTTALYFTGPQTLAAHFTFEYAIMTAEHALRTSSNFPATFFTP